MMESDRGREESRRRRLKRKKRRRLIRQLPVYLIGLLIVGLLGAGTYRLGRRFIRDIEAGPRQSGAKENGAGSESRDANDGAGSGENENAEGAGTGADGNAGSTGNGNTGSGGSGVAGDGPAGETSAGETSPQTTLSDVDALLEEARLTAAGYDYDGAINLLQNSGFAGDEKVAGAVAEYENIRSGLVPVRYDEVTHVFFHSLIMDESKAFDGDEDSAGYNQVMTTRDEFLKILDSMYEKGYVLVRLHDIARMTEGEDGSMRMTPQPLLLPEGKKPCVMSQDDVCYYPYMEGDGFASRMVIGEDGKPACEMKMDDGSVSVGAYDLVPLLEEFIRDHPDFSYKGARAVIAFTGYEGILGYRTAESYSDSPTYREDREAAAAVARCLRDNGWELASHSWGHRDMGTISFENFKEDCDKWEREVESLIGDTDIILFPFGADISDWHPYTRENERFNYLKSLGFDYYCNVDASRFWVQLGTEHYRQARRNLDGYRMWKDIEAGSDTASRKLDDLFRAEDVFSPNRPTPVEWN